MNKSENIGQLAESLSILQGEIVDPVKNRNSHNCRYADLTQVLNTIRPLMSKNGLSIVQFPGNNEGKITIETILMHKSGEWISNVYGMIPIEQKGANSAQSDGILITYIRRYAIISLLGISAQDDTDGNITSNRKLTGNEIDNFLKLCNNNKSKIERILKCVEVENLKELTLEQYNKAIEIIKKTDGA
jgi:hypothetical protein